MYIGISFIVPLFNGGETIAETLFSILETNLKDGDEIIVVDDCSTDNSVDIVKRIQRQYPGLIKLFQHSHNLGGASARNTAVTNSFNEYIFCLDSDNILVPHSIKFLLDHLINTSSDIASFGEVLFFRNRAKKVIKKWVFVNEKVDIKDALVSGINPISSGNYLYKKSTWIAVGGYPTNSKALDAWSFGMRQLSNGYKIAILKGFGYLHRIGHESYWIRDSKNNEISRRAVDFILGDPRIILDEESLAYLMTIEGRESWMKRGVARPLKLLGHEYGAPGTTINIEPHFVTLVYKLFNKFL